MSSSSILCPFSDFIKHALVCCFVYIHANIWFACEIYGNNDWMYKCIHCFCIFVHGCSESILACQYLCLIKPCSEGFGIDPAPCPATAGCACTLIFELLARESVRLCFRFVYFAPSALNFVWYQFCVLRALCNCCTTLWSVILTILPQYLNRISSWPAFWFGHTNSPFTASEMILLLHLKIVLLIWTC